MSYIFKAVPVVAAAVLLSILLLKSPRFLR